MSVCAQLRVAPAFRGLVDAFRGDELFERRGRHEQGDRQGKFATVEHRRQPTERGRYPTISLVG